ncbi:MAG: SMI1/KNR4 family protein [Planctomycetes bacterium]|nr:SMI1/KNR4 family protein [Planctomycetota bacterium]
MKRLDLDRIESELGITLPAAYRQVMMDYPLAPNSDASNFLLSTDAEQAPLNDVRPWWKRLLRIH